MPAGWQTAAKRLGESPDAEVRVRTRALGVLFGDAGALSAMRSLAADATADAAARRNAVRALVYKKDPALVPILTRLLDDPELRATAIRGLAAYDHADTPRVILAHYAALTDEGLFEPIRELPSRDRELASHLVAVRSRVETTSPPRTGSGPTAAPEGEQAPMFDDSAVARLSDLVWDRIVDITPAGSEEVFDLTVPGPASWLADGIVSHNSGAIEQDADIVMFIHRDDLAEEAEKKNVAELIVAKHRNGPTGNIKLQFNPNLTQFRNYAPGP